MVFGVDGAAREEHGRAAKEADVLVHVFTEVDIALCDHPEGCVCVMLASLSSVQVDGAYPCDNAMTGLRCCRLRNALITALQVMTSSVPFDGAWIATKL